MLSRKIDRYMYLTFNQAEDFPVSLVETDRDLQSNHQGHTAKPDATWGFPNGRRLW